MELERARPRSRRGLAAILVLAACGSTGTADPPVDARRECDGALYCTPPGPRCYPLEPVGGHRCAPDEKCTWVVSAEEPTGALACVPDGTVPADGACTLAATGIDDCVHGAVCIDGTCRALCDLSRGPHGDCEAGAACQAHEGLFAEGFQPPVVGVCTPQCDPLAQTGCPEGQGCYLLTRSGPAVTACANPGTVGRGEAITGTVYANSCQPGLQPRRRDSSLPVVMECGGLCTPTAVTEDVGEASEGGVAPRTCVASGAVAPDDPVNGESCRFWWAREDTGEVSPYSNTVGWCFRHAAFQYDSDLDQRLDAPFPRCITLTHGDVVPPVGTPPHDDALYFWCVPWPDNGAARPLATDGPARLRLDQLAP